LSKLSGEYDEFLQIAKEVRLGFQENTNFYRNSSEIPISHTV